MHPVAEYMNLTPFRFRLESLLCLMLYLPSVTFTNVFLLQHGQQSRTPTVSPLEDFHSKQLRSRELLPVRDGWQVDKKLHPCGRQSEE